MSIIDFSISRLSKEDEEEYRGADKDKRREEMRLGLKGLEQGKKRKI